MCLQAGTLPNSHGLAYTTRGLLESGALLGDERYTEAALRTASVLSGIHRKLGRLPATYDRDWTSSPLRVRDRLAQNGGVWLRLYQETGDAGLLQAGLSAVEQAAGLQSRGRGARRTGRVPGSFPLYGRYALLQYPNWATKFLADSLALRLRVIGMAADLDVTVVIPAFNAERTVGRVVEALRAQDPAPAEIVVVDDGPATGQLRSRPRPARGSSATTRRAAGGARNAGWEVATRPGSPSSWTPTLSRRPAGGLARALEEFHHRDRLRATFDSRTAGGWVAHLQGGRRTSRSASRGA